MALNSGDTISRSSEANEKSCKLKQRKSSSYRHKTLSRLETQPDFRGDAPKSRSRRRKSCSRDPNAFYKCWMGVERPLRRRPRRRAVVVGCNYSASNSIKLKGCVNDAHLFALALINLFEFHPQNILLLTDEQPNSVFCSKEEVTAWSETHLASCLPVRTHILLGLRWLVRGAIPGDILVFYFAGHGLQVDNMSGWEGEGYDECILPLDCAHASGDVNAITAVSIRQLLLTMDENVQLSIFLDCTGGQSMLDPAGTGSWKYIRGVKQKGLWPFVTNPTFKMERARYDPSVWTSEAMRKKEVRPRFVPGAEIGNTRDLVGALVNHSFENPSTKLHGFHICAAPWDEVAIEGRLPSLGIRALTPSGALSCLPVIAANKPIIHGVFTWALVRAMNDCAIGSAKAYAGDKTISYRTLLRELQKNVENIRNKQGFRKLNQNPSMTHYIATGSNPAELIFYPFGGRTRTAKYSDATEIAQLRRKEPTWLPRRDEYMSAWQAEVSLSIHSQQQAQHNTWKTQQSKLKEFWRTQVTDTDPEFTASMELLHSSPVGPFRSPTSLPLQSSPSMPALNSIAHTEMETQVQHQDYHEHQRFVSHQISQAFPHPSIAVSTQAALQESPANRSAARFAPQASMYLNSSVYAPTASVPPWFQGGHSTARNLPSHINEDATGLHS